MVPDNGTLADYFVPRKEPGEAGLPVLSVTMNNGLVRRDTLDRRTESAMSETAHSLVEPGDIAYNMMRMWQGASGLCSIRANISPAYVVMTPKANTNSSFAAHWLKSKDAIDLLWAYSHGITEDRLRLYPDDFLTIPATFPPLPEQRRIAAVLDTWDTAIATAERLVAAKRSAFEGLVHRLIDQSDVTRSELCDFATLVNAKITVEDAPFDYSIELDNMESGTGRLRGLTDASELLGQRAHFKADDVLFGKLRPYLRKFWFANEDGMASTEAWVFRADTKQCLPRYLYFLVRSHAFLGEANRPTGSRMPRADWDWVQSTPLPLPGTNEQSRIIDVLTLAEERWAVSGDHVTALRHQKRGLMQQLLTGKLRVPETIDRLMPDGGGNG